MARLSIIIGVIALCVAIYFVWVVPHKRSVVSTPAPTSVPVISPIPSIAVSPIQDLSPSQNFLYPGAHAEKNPDGSYTLLSNDDPGQITQWYQNKIAAHNMHSTSVSQTNSNNNILNVLDASSDTLEVKVTIERPAGNQTTTIVVREIPKG